MKELVQAKLVLQRPQIVLLEISASQGNPTLSVEAENLAREIAGEGTSPEILNLARRVAEPQIELMRIRQARYDLLSHYLNNSEYRPDQLQRRLDASLKFCASQMRREGPGALVPRDNDSAGIPQTAPLFSISLDAKRNSAEQCLTEQYDRKKKYYVICSCLVRHAMLAAAKCVRGGLFVQEKKLLVTGATGFVGQHLTPALAERGHRVVAVARHPMVFGPTVSQVLIQDVTSVDWMPLLQGVDVVIHLAAIAHRGAEVDEGLYDKVNRQATAALAYATARTGAKLIFVSSIAAQSPSSSDLVLTENDLCLPSGAYGRSKLNAEIDIAASGGQYVILRPPLVYGRGVKGNLRKLIQLARLPFPLPFGAVTNKRSLLAIDNLISAIGLLIQRDNIRNEVFLVADATPVSLPEIIASIRHGMGRPANLFAIPLPLLVGLFRTCRLTETWEKLAGNLVISIDKLSSIGYSPVFATSQGLATMTRTP